MDAVPTFVFPGLDGRTGMLTRFRDLAPQTHSVSLLDLPSDQWTYEDLTNHFARMISELDQCLLIAESFSGPLALMLAARHPQSVASVVLIGSFATSPLPKVARCVPWSLVFRLPLPSVLVRHFMLGYDCDSSLVREFKDAVHSIHSRVLAGRLREIVRVDARSLMSKIRCPILYLRPSRDAVIPEICIDTIRRLRSDAAIHTIEGPHLLLETKPLQAWQLIADFT